MRIGLTEFFRDLEKVKDKHMRAMLRFKFGLAQDIQFKAQDNVLKNFGAGRGKKSPLTIQAYGNSARRTGRGGALFNSIMIEKQGDNLSVTAGGLGVPYAAIHEYGGVIIPKKAKMLTIPFSSRFAGTRAKEFNLYMDEDDKWGLVLKMRGDDSIAFLLRRKSTIRARPYLGPAVQKATASERVRQLMLLYMGTDRLEIKIT